MRARQIEVGKITTKIAKISLKHTTQKGTKLLDLEA
jgi:hypothetical protein